MIGPGLILYPSGLTPNSQIIDPSTGQFTRDGRNLILALFNRTGGASGAPSVKTGLVVANAVDVFNITGDWNEFDTVALNGVCQLPIMALGSDCIIFNNGANGLKITPQAGVQIDGVDSYLLATAKMQWFRAWTTTMIRSTQLG